jgi:rhodanese-related sulfurtransferase
VNNSNIDAKLILDLRDYPEFEISVPTESMDKEDLTSEIIVPITDTQTGGAININDLDVDDIKDPLNEDEEEDDDDDEEEQNRYVQINVKAGGKGPLKLNLKYTPADVDDNRNF